MRTTAPVTPLVELSARRSVVADGSAAACTLGLDLGTQGARAAVVAADGRLVALADVSYAAGTDRRAGRIHEQDPQAWWVAATTAIRQALARCDHPRISAMAIDSTSGTIVVQDADGSAGSPALMYDDARADGQLRRAIGSAGELWLRLGYRPQRSWALPKAMWLVEQGHVGRGARIVHQADYIAGRLAGTRVATDTSHALKSGVEPLTGCWPVELATLGLGEPILPPVVAPGTVIGHVGAAGAQDSALPIGTPIRAGMTDGCAAQIAAGALEPGTWTSALGTTLTIKGSSAAPLVDPLGVLYNHRHPDATPGGPGWLPGGASNVGAGALHPFAGRDLRRLSAEAAVLDPADGVTYPLTAVGERFPFAAPDAAGFSTIIAPGDAERVAGVFQGVAYIERLCYERVAVLGAHMTGPVVVTGATCANTDWNQLRSDVLGRVLVVPESGGAARGMAVLAAAAAGDVAATASISVRHIARYEPDGRRGQRHLDNYHALVRELGERGWLEPDAFGAPGQVAARQAAHV